MALRVSTAHGDKSEGVHKDDETQLSNGEPELGLAKIPHSKDIGDSKIESTSRSLWNRGALGLESCKPVCEDAGRDDCRRGNVIAPICQDQVQGCNLKWNQDCFEQKEVPPDHESPSFVDPDIGVLNKGCADGHEDGHLGESVVHQGEDDGLQDEGNQQTACSSMQQTIADCDEERCPNGATDGKELYLARFQMALQRCLVQRRLANGIVACFRPGLILRGGGHLLQR